MTIFVIFLIESDIEVESNLTPCVEKNAVNINSYLINNQSKMLNLILNLMLGISTKKHVVRFIKI